MKTTYDVIIIGSGPAGYTAAIYAARANLKTLLLGGSRAQVGGQLMLTSEVENFPGFEESVMGPDLMVQMRNQAKRFGTELIDITVDKVNFDVKPFEIHSQEVVYSARSVIIATGAQAQWLGLPNEQRLLGRGVSACATCDAFFFKDMDVAVVGGGDSAMEEALALAKFARHVTVIHRRDSLRASKIMQERAIKNPKIDFVWNSVVSDVVGEDKLESIQVKNITNDNLSSLDVQGLFVAIGHKPSTELFKDKLALDKNGYIKVRDNVLTDIEGVFVAGDVADARYRQAITAAADGCRAAMEAEKYLEQ